MSAPTRTDDVQLFATAEEADRLHEVWRKSCKAYSAAEGPMFDKRSRGEPISDAEQAKVNEAETLEAADSNAYWTVEQRLIKTPAHTPQGLATKIRIFQRYHGHKNESEIIDGFLTDAVRIGCAGLTKDREEGAALSTNWRQTLDEYTRLTIATNASDGPTLAADCAAHTAIECQIAEAPINGLESLIAKLAIIWNTDRGWIGSDPRSIALSSVLDFLAGETGFDPFIEYDRDDEMIPLSTETKQDGDASC